MNCLCFGILLAVGLWTLTPTSEAFIARSAGLPVPLSFDPGLKRCSNIFGKDPGCHHNGTWYADRSLVPTIEKCLNCQCNRKTLVCRLKVCPEIPLPPPRGCVVVQKKNTCCPYLSCARLEAFYKIPITRRIIAYLDHYERESIDRVVNDNMLQRRSDDSESDLSVCVKNGTVYKSGSAMSSSNLCSYCYCIGGSEKCVKPKCMLPVEGCKPIFVDSTCCPVRYDCSTKPSGKSSQEVRYRKTANKHFQRMSQRLQRNRGCTVQRQFYAEGQKMKSEPDRPCDICFCIRGSRRCAPKKCAPALKDCMPVVPKGQCCPSSYDCGSQRDYRRAQNSRQFNLFSLLFGKDEDKSGHQPPASSGVPAQYPHDRDPALATAANQYETHELAVEASSEKSILDTIKEGLEFIDGNTHHMLEENMDLVNLQAKRESIKNDQTTTTTTTAPAQSTAFDMGTTTTELSFLDLLLGESSETTERSDDAPELASASESESESEQPVQDELSWIDILLGPAEQQKTNETLQMNGDNATDDHLATTIKTIDRLDVDVEDIGASGEIFVGSDSTQSELSQQKPPIKPQQIEYIPLKEIPPEFNETLITEKPGEETNDFLTAILDGISNILGPEIPENTTSSAMESQIVSTTTTPIPKPTKALPSFKPLPAHKTQAPARINSKIANMRDRPPSTPPTVRTQSYNTTTTINPVVTTSTTNHGGSVIRNTTLSTTTTTSAPTTTTKRTTTTTSTTTATTTTPRRTTTSNVKTTKTTTEKPKIITTTTTKKPSTTTTTTTAKPLIIETNPSILEADPLDDSTEPTLPPSLPNLKIIPFLPTDAVETANTKVYEYFPGGSASIYDDPSQQHYASYAVNLEEDNQAKYIYKFKIEGPETAPSIPEVIPRPNSDESFLKYEYMEKSGGFSPPTKTEGGFVPKEPLPLIEDGIVVDGGASKHDEIYSATMHIIDITTPQPFTENLTNIIEITTPDPFKDVIHTEPPPDLTMIIQDKAKIEEMAQKASTISTLISFTESPSMRPSEEASEEATLASTIAPSQKNKNKLETLLDILFKDEQEPMLETSTAVPPFKSLPQTTVNLISTKPSTSTTNQPTHKRIPPSSNQTTRKPNRTKSPQNFSTKNRTKPHGNRRNTTSSINKTKTNKTTSTLKTTTTTTATPMITASTPISSAVQTTNSPILISKPAESALQSNAALQTSSSIATATTLYTPTATASIRTTKNPFLMSPFDKLPFMNTSFEIKRQQPTTKSTSSSSIPTVSHALERLEGLDAAYDIASTSSSPNPTTTTTTTRVVHSPYGAVNEKHSISTSNSLTDPTGILKLAGCNIYGRMYRVGRIILELSSPCVECKCTETGVKCGQLDC